MICCNFSQTSPQTGDLLSLMKPSSAPANDNQVIQNFDCEWIGLRTQLKICTDVMRGDHCDLSIRSYYSERERRETGLVRSIPHFHAGACENTFVNCSR